MTDINKHPTLRKLYETSLSLERLPASPEQTATAILLGDANRAVDALIDSHSAALAAAVQAEREACAMIADFYNSELYDGNMAKSIAEDIRSRGPAPAVDVMAVVRRLVKAWDAEHKRPITDDEWVAGYREVCACIVALRALVDGSKENENGTA